MPKNIRAFVFIFLLLAVLTFLVGFRYGRFVERTDNTYISQITPTTLPTYTPAPTLKTPEFKTYRSTACKLSFLYPDSLEEKAASSQEAHLSEKNNNIYISCDRQVVFAKREALAELESIKTATASGQKVSLYNKNRDTTVFTISNPLLGRSVFIEVTKNLQELVLQTLRFER